MKYFNTVTIVSTLVALFVFGLILWLVAKNSNWMAPSTAATGTDAPATDPTIAG